MKEKVIADRNTGKMKQLLTVALLASMCMVLFAFVPAFAAADLASLLNQIIGIVKAIFVAVGIILWCIV